MAPRGLGPARGRHWDAVYRRGWPAQLSWYQAEPAVSLQLLDALRVRPGAAVLDVGGASLLVDRLVDRGFRDVTVLDVSAAALAASRCRLDSASGVHWLHQDLLAWQPDRRFDVWHDRAVFHFLVDQADRDRYRQVLTAALRPGGVVIVGAFAADGPDVCSGLPVMRYQPAELATALGAGRGLGLEVVAARREEHHTPAGALQPFTWLAGRRT